MSSPIEEMIKGLAAVAMVMVAYYFGGRQKTGNDLMNTVITGFSKVQEVSLDSFQDYKRLIDENAQTNVRVATLENLVAQYRKENEELKDQVHRAFILSQNLRQAEILLVDTRQEIETLREQLRQSGDAVKERDRVISSVIILVDAEAHGKDPGPVITETAKSILYEWVEKSKEAMKVDRPDSSADSNDHRRNRRSSDVDYVDDSGAQIERQGAAGAVDGREEQDSRQVSGRGGEEDRGEGPADRGGFDGPHIEQADC